MPKSKTNAFILNCVPSSNIESDWTMEDAIDAGTFKSKKKLPPSVDLREDGWLADNQGNTGACVGYATAYGVLRWHYFFKKGWIKPLEKPSARFIWMANKETDNFTRRPTTFLESTGTSTKLALQVAQKYGCVTEKILPMNGRLSSMKESQFYALAAKWRISSYHNLGTNLTNWRKWLAFNGPILTRLNVDKTWDRATQTRGELKQYRLDTVRGGHAVCLVGYTKDHFIVRNSWGGKWGDKGFAYASNEYAEAAFTEAYGAVV